MRKGARVMAFATAAFTTLSILFLWMRAKTLEVAPLDFLIMALIVIIVWTAIGAVMAFYIVMIIRKNENRER